MNRRRGRGFGRGLAAILVTLTVGGCVAAAGVPSDLKSATSLLCQSLSDTDRQLLMGTAADATSGGVSSATCKERLDTKLAAADSTARQEWLDYFAEHWGGERGSALECYFQEPLCKPKGASCNKLRECCGALPPGSDPTKYDKGLCTGACP